MVKTTSEKTHQATNPEQWVDLYGDYLYRFALGRLRNPEEAQNVVQETFLAALSATKNFAGKSSERTWLVSILKHKIVDQYRHNYREKPVSTLQENEEAVETFFDHVGHPKKAPADWLPEPQLLLENKEFWQILKGCMEKLPKAINAAFTLREIEKVDTKEICKILNITSSNLWVMLHRARLQLRYCLEVNWFEK